MKVRYLAGVSRSPVFKTAVLALKNCAQPCCDIGTVVNDFTDIKGAGERKQTRGTLFYKFPGWTADAALLLHPAAVAVEMINIPAAVRVNIDLPIPGFAPLGEKHFKAGLLPEVMPPAWYGGRLRPADIVEFSREPEGYCNGPRPPGQSAVKRDTLRPVADPVWQ